MSRDLFGLSTSFWGNFNKNYAVECDVPAPEGINEKFYLGSKKTDKCLHIAFAHAMLRGLEIEIVPDNQINYRIFAQENGHRHGGQNLDQHLYGIRVRRNNGG